MRIVIMKRVINISFILLIPLLIHTSCKKSEDLEESCFYDFDREGMKPDLQYIFNPFKDFQDSLKINEKEIYSIDLIIRYSELCELRKIPLDVEYASLDNDSLKTKRIEISLYDESDYIEGKGNYGIYDVTVPFLKHQVVEKGFYISISTPEKSTHGILSLGIICKNIKSSSDETDS